MNFKRLLILIFGALMLATCTAPTPEETDTIIKVPGDDGEREVVISQHPPANLASVGCGPVELYECARTAASLESLTSGQTILSCQQVGHWTQEEGLDVRFIEGTTIMEETDENVSWSVIVVVVDNQEVTCLWNWHGDMTYVGFQNEQIAFDESGAYRCALQLR